MKKNKLNNYVKPKNRQRPLWKERLLHSISQKENIRMTYFLCFMACLIGNVSFAQIDEFDTMSDKQIENLRQEPCSSTLKALEQYRSMDRAERLELKNRQEKFDRNITEFIAKSRIGSKNAAASMNNLVIPMDPDQDPNYTTNPEYTIPVVFHVVHDGDDESILSVEDAKRVLKRANEDMNGLGEFRNSIHENFKNDESHVGIRLVLAQKNPEGKPTTGVTHGVHFKTYGTNQNNSASIKADTKWPTNKYLNVWVVNAQSSWSFTDGDAPSGGSAYAFLPANDNGLDDDGIYTGITMAYWVAGDQVNGESLDYKQFRHIFTHEFGHWLGLNHTWGSGANGDPTNCNKDDGVADTPNTVGVQYAPGGREDCLNTFSSCGEMTNVHEFMNYTACQSMFTHGQKEVMVGSLNSDVAGRNNIVSQQNLDATLYTNGEIPRLMVSSELGNGKNIFREVRDLTGALANKVIMYLDDAAFANSHVGTTLSKDVDFTIANVPSGLQAEIRILDNKTAEFKLLGNATAHDKSDSIDNLELSFNDSTFENNIATSIENASGIIFTIKFRDNATYGPYTKLVDDVNPLYNNSDGLEYGFYERRRVNFGYGNAMLEFKFRHDSLFVRVNGKTGAAGLILDNDGSANTMDKVSILSKGATVGENSNWSVKNSSTAEEKYLKNWKYIASQNQADLSNYLNKNLYLGAYLSYGGRTFYQWVSFTLFKTEYGKLTFKLIDHAYGYTPDAAMICGNTSFAEDNYLVKDYSLVRESASNDGSIHRKSLELILRSENNSFKNTVTDSDYTITNLPSGLHVSSVETLNEGKRLKFNVSGSYEDADFSNQIETIITLKNSAYTNGVTNDDLISNQKFGFYAKKEGYFHGVDNVTLNKDKTHHQIASAQIKFKYHIDYTQSPPQRKITAHSNQGGTAVKYDVKFIADTPGTNNIKFLEEGTLIDENIGLDFPTDLGEHIVIYDKEYTKLAGKTGFVGFEYVTGRFRYYTWVKIKVGVDGESLEIIDYARREMPGTPIAVGDSGPPPPKIYCEANGSNGDEVITSVSFAGINKTSDRADSGYSNFLSEKGTVIPGETYELVVGIDGYRGGEPDEVYAWIDWDADKDFDDEGEYYFVTKTGDKEGRISITVPELATKGETRMRVRVAYKEESNIPCGATTYGEVEDYTIAIEGENAQPTVAITAPATGEELNAGTVITIEADAEDTDGTITKVEFFNGTEKLGEDTTAPYSFDWENTTLGQYELTAKATDNEGAETISSIVSITVINAQPIVSITSPSSGEELNLGETVTITATAQDVDGSITSVEFFNGVQKLGEDATAPYSIDWNIGKLGIYTITAKATDNLGATTTSSIVSGTVIESDIPNYCTASGAEGVEAIIAVNFAGIDNRSDRNVSGYENFTTISGNVEKGSSYNLLVTIEGYRGGDKDEIYAWFDWNKNENYEDDELTTLAKIDGVTGEATITIPETAEFGTIGMRLRVAYYDTAGVPCGESRYGEVEDYILKISKEGAGSRTGENSFLVNSVKTNNVSVGPNPFSQGELTISFETKEKGMTIISLYNTKGVRILQRNKVKQAGKYTSIHIDEHLETGVYFLKIMYKNQIFTSKLVIK